MVVYNTNDQRNNRYAGSDPYVANMSGRQLVKLIPPQSIYIVVANV
jgi:hypothetical protein